MAWDSRAGGRDGGSTGRPSGWRVLIPGYPQWTWSQRGRGLVLFGSYCSAMAAGLFSWGTLGGLAMLAFAVGAHVASVADVVRQAAFPGFGRWVPWFSASCGIGLGCYGPALAAAGIGAWPTWGDSSAYAVNLRAYQHDGPSPGEWVWMAPETPEGARAPQSSRVVRVLATGGQAVEWSEGRFLLGGVPWPEPPRAPGGRCRRLALDVPEGYLLVSLPFEERSGRESAPGPAGGWELVPATRVRGKAWAQLYPIWSRRLLP